MMVVALPTLLCCACAQRESQQSNPGATEAASQEALAAGEVKGVDVAGLEALLDAAAGRVVVVNLWATWCVPCVAEMPELAEFYREHSRAEVAFFAVSLDDPKEMDGAVKKFMEDKELPFPAYVLTERDIDAVSKALRQEIYGALPTTIVYDRKGAVKKMWEGAITREELNVVVKPLL